MEANGYQMRLSRLEQRVDDMDRHTSEQLRGLGYDVRDLRKGIEDERSERTGASKDYRLAFYALFGVLMAAIISAGGAVWAASL